MPEDDALNEAKWLAQLASAAEGMKKLYDALCIAGFREDQALQLISAMMVAAVSGGGGNVGHKHNV